MRAGSASGVASIWGRVHRGVGAERAVGNGFGLAEAAIGLASGFLLANLLAAGYLAIAHRSAHTGSYGEDLCSLIGLWAGFVGGALFASKSKRPGPATAVSPAPELAATDAGAARPVRMRPSGRISEDYGLSIRPLVDVPIGILVGVVSQFALVPLLELPLVPFVHNLSQQIGKPAEQLTSNVFGAGFVVLAIFVCVGSPVVEEVFFRGLVLRALLGRIGSRQAVPDRGSGGRNVSAPHISASKPWLSRPWVGTALSIAVSSLLFALVHFETIQFLGLAGFGAVLAYLAWRTGRLGPGIVAHAAFNSVAIIHIATSRG